MKPSSSPASARWALSLSAGWTNLGYVLANRTVLGQSASKLFQAQVADRRIAEYLLVEQIGLRLKLRLRQQRDVGALDRGAILQQNLGAVGVDPLQRKQPGGREQ